MDYPGFNLMLDSVNKCRALCCANPHCVSVTMGPAGVYHDKRALESHPTWRALTCNLWPLIIAGEGGGENSHTCWLNPKGGVEPFAQETTLMAFVKRNNSTAVASPTGSAPCHFNYPNRDPQVL
jgi:hypothetical protein